MTGDERCSLLTRLALWHIVSPALNLELTSPRSESVKESLLFFLTAFINSASALRSPALL